VSIREPEDRLLRETKEHLDRQTAELDTATLARLRQARKAAMGSFRERPSWVQTWMRPVAAGLGTLAVLAVLTAVLFQRVSVTEEAPILSALEDVEIFSSGEDLELFENLEFYSWLSEAESREKT